MNFNLLHHMPSQCLKWYSREEIVLSNNRPYAQAFTPRGNLSLKRTEMPFLSSTTHLLGTEHGIKESAVRFSLTIFQ